MGGSLLIPWGLKGWSSLGLRLYQSLVLIIGYCAPIAVSWGQIDGCTGAFSGKTGQDVEMRKRRNSKTK